jgi:hypothetical protein
MCIYSLLSFDSLLPVTLWGVLHIAWSYFLTLFLKNLLLCISCTKEIHCDVSIQAHTEWANSPLYYSFLLHSPFLKNNFNGFHCYRIFFGPWPKFLGSIEINYGRGQRKEIKLTQCGHTVGKSKIAFKPISPIQTLAFPLNRGGRNGDRRRGMHNY